MTRNTLRRLSPRLLLVSTVAMMLIAQTPASAQVGTLDQQQPNATGNGSSFTMSAGVTILVALTFTAGLTGELN